MVEELLLAWQAFPTSNLLVGTYVVEDRESVDVCTLFERKTNDRLPFRWVRERQTDVCLPMLATGEKANRRPFAVSDRRRKHPQNVVIVLLNRQSP